MYLIDSDILINFLKGEESAVKILGKIEADGRNTSVICVGEILEGLSENKTDQFKNLINFLNVYEIDLKTVAKFAEIRKELRKKGNLIDNFDLLIASTCLVHNLTLITNNLSHFKRIPDLKLFKYKIK